MGHITKKLYFLIISFVFISGGVQGEQISRSQRLDLTHFRSHGQWLDYCTKWLLIDGDPYYNCMITKQFGRQVYEIERLDVVESEPGSGGWMGLIYLYFKKSNQTCLYRMNYMVVGKYGRKLLYRPFGCLSERIID